MSTTGTLPTAVNGPSLLPIAMEAIHRLVLTAVILQTFRRFIGYSTYFLDWLCSEVKKDGKNRESDGWHGPPKYGPWCAVFLIALIDVMACMVLLLLLIATVHMVDHVK